MSGDDGELHEEHEEHVNHEAWVIPYADLLTLLMAMFIALFAMSTVDVTKFKAFALGFHEALGGGKIDSGIGGTGKATSPVVGDGNGTGPFSGGSIMPSDSGISGTDLQKILEALAGGKAAKAKEQQSLEQVQQDIQKAAKDLGLGGKVQTKRLENGLDVTLLTDQVLFPSGSATLEPGATPLLTIISNVLQKLDNPVKVIGHTDTDAIHTAEFPSNRYLSAARASAVVDFFAAHGIPSARLEASGRGFDDPIAPNDTSAGKARNRRVEIVVESKLIKQTLDDAGLSNKPAQTSTPPAPSVSPNLTPNLGRGGGGS